MNRINSRRQELVRDIAMILHIVMVEDIDRFRAIANVEDLARLKPLFIIWPGRAF